MRVLLDVLNERAEDGHLLGEATLGALFLLCAHVLGGEVAHTVVETLLRSVEEVLGLRLEIDESTRVGLLFVHYINIY